MTDDRYNRPAAGTADWHEPLNENFADLEGEVVEVVDAWADLPAEGEVESSSAGQWPRFYVLEDRAQVRVTDEATEIVGGLGSAEHPLPELRAGSVHAEAAATRRLNAERVVGPDAAFDSIQAAHDDLPDGGGRVAVRDGYDPADEDYPVTITKKTNLHGDGQVRLEPPDSETDAVEVDLEATINYNPTHNPVTEIRGLEIHGGRDGIVILGTSHGRITNCQITRQERHGIDIRDDGEAPHSWVVDKCFVRKPGGVGIRDDDARAHALSVDNTVLEACGGAGAVLGSASQSVRGSVVQYNGGPGLVISGAKTVVAGGTYLESNDEDGGTPNQEILVDGGSSTTVRDCFINGLGNVSWAIRLTGGAEEATIDSLHSVNHTSGRLAIDSSCSHVEIAYASHVFDSSEPIVAYDDAPDTRSHGVVKGHNPTDLSAVTGDYRGQRGMDDGTNVSTDGPMLCTWTGSAWQPTDGSEPFQ